MDVIFCSSGFCVHLAEQLGPGCDWDEYWSLGKGSDGLFDKTATVVGVVVRQVPRPRWRTMLRAAVSAGAAA